MSYINTRLGTFEKTSALWVGAVGANTSLVDAVTGYCARAIIVGVNAGSLVVTEAGGVARTYSTADIIAQQGFLRGNFEALVAAGSASHTLTVGW
jgi:hypothetical protein